MRQNLVIRWVTSHLCCYASYYQPLSKPASAVLTSEDYIAVYFYWDFAMFLVEMFACCLHWFLYTNYMTLSKCYGLCSCAN